MKKTIGTILLAVLSLSAIFFFTACSNEQYYGTYVSEDNTVELVLSEDKATFGSLDTWAEYSVKYTGKSVGINKDSFKCYWGEFTYEFAINEDGSLTLKGYISGDGNLVADTDIDIIFIKK